MKILDKDLKELLLEAYDMGLEEMDSKAFEKWMRARIIKFKKEKKLDRPCIIAYS